MEDRRVGGRHCVKIAWNTRYTSTNVVSVLIPFLEMFSENETFDRTIEFSRTENLIL